MADKDNLFGGIPKETAEICAAIMMEKVSPDGAFGTFRILVDEFLKAETDNEKIMTALGYVYGLLSFGYYCGADDTLKTLKDLASEWNSRGKPDNFMKDILKKSASNFSEN